MSNRILHLDCDDCDDFVWLLFLNLKKKWIIRLKGPALYQPLQEGERNLN